MVGWGSVSLCSLQYVEYLDVYMRDRIGVVLDSVGDPLMSGVDLGLFGRLLFL